MKLADYLAVAYGADEIVYWPYRSYAAKIGGAKSWSPDNPPIQEGMQEFLVSTPDSVCLDPDSANWNSFRTFIWWDGSIQQWIKVNDPSSLYKWDAGKQVHAVLDSLGDILNGREFLGAGPWNELETSGTVFTGIRSKEYGYDAAFIQVADFRGADGIDYHMLINRRTWPGPEACQCPANLSDSQHIYFATTVPITGESRAIDIITGDTIMLIDSSGCATGQIFLPPGEAAILKFDTAFTYYWKNEFAGIDHFPKRGTHYISGDITIDSGDSLVIDRGNKFYALSDNDSTSGGAYTKLTELIVEGYLKVVGDLPDPVTFSSVTDTTRSWYGIRVVDQGATNISYAVIDNALYGYKNTSPDHEHRDTLIHTSMHNAYYGVRLEMCNALIKDLELHGYQDIYYSPVAIGLEYIDDTIYDCRAEQFAYGIYFYGGSPTIDSCRISKSVNGIYAYAPFENDTALINECTIDSCTYGIITQNYTNSWIRSCQIHAVGDNGRGIWNPYELTHCRVEFTTIKNGGDSAILVYTKGPNTDLGSGGSVGFNCLYHCRLGDDPYPPDGYLLYNASDDTTLANRCCWGNISELCPGHRWRDGVYRLDPSDNGPVNVIALACNFYSLCICRDPWPIGKANVSDSSGALPTEYSLSQNHPNPFNPVTTIDYTIPNPGRVTIRVYNILGQEVIVLVDEYQDPGDYTMEWYGDDKNGKKVASGIYYYQLVADDYVSAKKMMVLK